MEGIERQKLHKKFMFENVSKTTVNETEIYQPRKGDVFIVGLPKSGTTWLQQIVHQLRTKGDENFKDIYGVTCFIPTENDQGNFNVNAEQVCNPRIYKFHLNYGIIKTTSDQKHIFVIRDPYDAVYSYIKFENRWFGNDKDFSDELLNDMLKKARGETETKLCDFEFLASWWEHKNNSNIMFVFYEDLIKNLSEMIKKIASFVEIKIINDDELSRITYLCSFDYMAKNKEKFQGTYLAEIFAKNIGIESWSPNVGMVRVDGGKVGEGSNIAKNLKSTIDKKWTDTMRRRFGFDNYGDMYRTYSLLKDQPN